MPHDRLLRVINQVRENKRQPPIAAMSPEMRLREDLDFASLDLAELTVRIEEEFGIDVFADGVVATVGEIVEKVSARHS